MASLDLEKLLAPISEETPVGENLEYDPGFGELDLAARRRDEQVMGDEVNAAEEPDWPDVQSRSIELFGRTKDLRVAAHLTNACLHIDGFSGLADSVRLIRGLLESYWEGIFPPLDAEDDDDPTLRVNSLVSLVDPAGILGATRMTPIVSSTVLGKFSIRDHSIAGGDLVPSENDASIPEMSHIDGAFMEAELDDIVATSEAVNQVLEDIAGIESFVAEKVGAVNAPDLSELTHCLKDIKTVVADHLSRRGVGEAAEGAESAAQGGGAPGTINSRDDVIRTLDRICDYFVRNEPTSPIPLYLRRAQRMVSMEFLEILREITPDGVHQAETIFGVRQESK
jgi:type VI secretion system protein ImpA